MCCVLAMSVVLSACSLFEPREVVAALEVQNRTLDDLVYIAADGEVLAVPACGTATDGTFRIDGVRVRAAGGYVRGFGAVSPEWAGRLVHVIEVASAADSSAVTAGPAPDVLPPCDGHAEAQAGT